MAKGAYIGIDSLARKVKKCYIGIDGVARKVKKAYIGVDGVARLFWNSKYTTASVTSSTLPTGYTFYNSGTDVAVPYNGNSNILEIFTGILPYNSKSYLYNISENTLTESSKTASINLLAYDGFASTDGYLYFINSSLTTVYKLKQSDFSIVSSATISVSSSYSLIPKATVELGDYVYYFLGYSYNSSYRTYLYALNKNTLEFSQLSTDYATLANYSYAGAVVKDGYIYYFNTYTSSGTIYLYCYKYDTSGNKSTAFALYDNPFGSGYNLTRVMQLDDVTYLFAGNVSTQASKIYKVDYTTNTISLFKELSTPCYTDTWLDNGSGTVISTYESSATGNFTKLTFE